MGSYNFKNTTLYKKTFSLAMEVYGISKNFPKEEKYSLTDQIRRSSRSVCANLAEAYRKKRYQAHFISKLTDCDAENSETSVWLDFALHCEYISIDIYTDLLMKNEEIGKMISHAINNPEKY
ncbi:MAG: four helix bundle protein [Bacteroidetes bacterium]|nr:four helix bundle protein [Bacteroidota bacterium]